MPLSTDLLKLMTRLEQEELTEEGLESLVTEAEKIEQLELDKIEKQQALDAAALAAISSGQQAYEAFEHDKLGTEAFAAFLTAHPGFAFDHLGDSWLGDGNNIGCFEFGSGNLFYSPGQISALAGDFYGVPKHPISQLPSQLYSEAEKSALESSNNTDSQREARFEAAFATLMAADRKEIDKILKTVAEEKKLVAGAPAGVFPATAFAKGETTRNLRYIFATHEHCHSRYLALALDNQDHFFPDNIPAYETGHAVALKKAKAARDTDDHVEKEKFLREAFLMECFAQHFEQDLFSSGHLRVPRKELTHTFQKSRVSSLLASKLGGWLSKLMHDEDNKYGVEVSNADNSFTWTAYGDKHLLDEGNKSNKEQAIKALQAGFEDIFLVYHGNEPTHGYRGFWPKPTTDGKHQPLFKLQTDEEGTHVVRRKDVKNIHDKEFISNWSTVGTLFRKPQAVATASVQAEIRFTTEATAELSVAGSTKGV